MRESVLDSSGLRECCGRKPIFRRNTFKTTVFWEIECGCNPERHRTGLCGSEAMARWRWQNQKFRK